jgi:hypothetical protein
MGAEADAAVAVGSLGRKSSAAATTTDWVTPMYIVSLPGGPVQAQTLKPVFKAPGTNLQVET